MSDTSREDFEIWFGASKYTQVILPTARHKQPAFDGWQARGELEAKKLEASDARYQARIDEINEAIRGVFGRELYEGRSKEENRLVQALSTTTPDTALQRKVLEARIAQQNWANKHSANDGLHEERLLREQLASLNRNETLGE